MRYASVCDGIGAVHVAWQPLGWHCEWTAEIDAFPAAVVEQRWGFPNRGDMTRFKEWDDGPIDLLVGGTPCQSFSVAGLRKGLHDPRGGLMLTFLEIAQRYRPRWVVWENVPGVLSSNGGRDFGAFLGALGELGYGWAYRVLDAQWFGVAQRRRRVFVVGCLGDERRAAQVLFESESVRRDNPPSRAKGQGATAAASSGTVSGGVVNAVCSKWSKGTGCPAGDECQNLVAFHPTQDPISSEDGLVHALGTGSSGGCATAAVAFKPSHYTRGKDGAPSEVAAPLSADADKGDQDTVVATPFTKSKRAQSTTDDESWVPGEVAPTFNCFDQGDTRATTVVAQGQAVMTPMAVRRLTPRECERLQGFPDDYTAIEYRKKPAADGPRYKALGNSMAVPVMHWLGARIDAVARSDGQP